MLQSYEREVYKSILEILERDLANRRTKNDNFMPDNETAFLRGEIQYIKQLQKTITERLLGPER